MLSPLLCPKSLPGDPGAIPAELYISLVLSYPDQTYPRGIKKQSLNSSENTCLSINKYN